MVMADSSHFRGFLSEFILRLLPLRQCSWSCDWERERAVSIFDTRFRKRGYSGIWRVVASSVYETSDVLIKLVLIPGFSVLAPARTKAIECLNNQNVPARLMPNRAPTIECCTIRNHGMCFTSRRLKFYGRQFFRGKQSEGYNITRLIHYAGISPNYS